MSNDNEPDWLHVWRKERDARRSRVVPLTAEPFGVIRLSPIELADWSVQHQPVVFILYRGTFLSRNTFHSWMRSMDGYKGFTYVHVNEVDAVGLLTSDLGSDAVDAWPMMRHLASVAVRNGRNVVVDAAKYGDLRGKVSDIFTTGPRAVVVVDPTAIYEDEGGSDGVTGVVWTDRWERPRGAGEF